MHARIISAAVLGSALVAAPASAHVTVQPKTAVAGEYTVQNVRVPNETDDADTVKVAVRFPAGFASVSYAAVPGWTVKVEKQKLAVPVKTDDGEITEGVSQVIWTGHGSTGRIRPGQFQDFPLSVRIPGKAGDTLTFKAVQTYDDGEIVRWIGTPDADEPAPTVKVVAAAGDASAAPAAPAAATADDDDDDGGDGLAIGALVVALLGVALGAGGLLAARRAGTPAA
jgi:uncharacterized protein